MGCWRELMYFSFYLWFYLYDFRDFLVTLHIVNNYHENIIITVHKVIRSLSIIDGWYPYVIQLCTVLKVYNTFDQFYAWQLRKKCYNIWWSHAADWILARKWQHQYTGTQINGHYIHIRTFLHSHGQTHTGARNYTDIQYVCTLSQA